MTKRRYARISLLENKIYLYDINKHGYLVRREYEIIGVNSTKKFEKTESIVQLLKEAGYEDTMVIFRNFPLLEMRISLLYNCNLKCKHCFFSLKDRNILFNREILREILKVFKESGGIIVILTGGEPLLYPYLYDVLRWASKLGILIEINTNGMFPEKIEKILKKWRDNIHLIKISLDGWKKAHEYLRGDGTFEPVLETISVVSKFRVPIQINTVLHKLFLRNIRDNLQYMHDFFSEVSNVLIWAFKVLVEGPHLRYKAIVPSKEDLVMAHAKIIKFLSSISLSTVIKGTWMSYILGLLFNPKTFFKNYIYVTPSLEVYRTPCQEKPIATLSAPEILKKISQRFVSTNSISCQNCIMRNICFYWNKNIRRHLDVLSRELVYDIQKIRKSNKLLTNI